MNVAALLQDSPSEDRRRIPQQQQQPQSPQWRSTQSSWQDTRRPPPSSSPQQRRPSSPSSAPPISSPRTAAPPQPNTTALPPPPTAVSSPSLGPSWGPNHVHSQMGDARHLMSHNIPLVGGGQRSIMHPMDRERDRERLRRHSNASNAPSTTPASNTNTLVGPGTGAAPSFLSLGLSFFFSFYHVTDCITFIFASNSFFFQMINPLYYHPLQHHLPLPIRLPSPGPNHLVKDGPAVPGTKISENESASVKETECATSTTASAKRGKGIMPCGRGRCASAKEKGMPCATETGPTLSATSLPTRSQETATATEFGPHRRPRLSR